MLSPNRPDFSEYPTGWLLWVACFRVLRGSMSRFSGLLLSPIYLPTRYSVTPGGSEFSGFLIKNRFHFKTLSLIFRSSVFLCYPDFRDTLLNTQTWFWLTDCIVQNLIVSSSSFYVFYCQSLNLRVYKTNLIIDSLLFRLVLLKSTFRT